MTLKTLLNRNHKLTLGQISTRAIGLALILTLPMAYVRTREPLLEQKMDLFSLDTSIPNLPSPNVGLLNGFDRFDTRRSQPRLDWPQRVPSGKGDASACQFDRRLVLWYS